MLSNILDRLKDIKIILIIVLILSWITGGLLYYITTKSHRVEIDNRDTKINELKMELSAIGEMVEAYKLVTDMKGGKRIEETDIEIIQIPKAMSERVVTDITQVLGKYYKLDLCKGSILTKDSIYEEVLTDDLRYFDIVTHLNPIGLEENSYVDIRIQMPLGEDYIAIPHRKVIEINKGILKVAVDETDIHKYNSMLVDSLIYPGTQIYAVEYIEGGVQKAAESYYPASTNILAIAQKDPNLLKTLKEDMLQRRGILETGLNSAGLGLDEKEREEKSKVIEKGRERILRAIEESQKEVDKERKEFERQQAKERG